MESLKLSGRADLAERSLPRGFITDAAKKIVHYVYDLETRMGSASNHGRSASEARLAVAPMRSVHFGKRSFSESLFL
jgi:hypothetical protein